LGALGGIVAHADPWACRLLLRPEGMRPGLAARPSARADFFLDLTDLFDLFDLVVLMTTACEAGPSPYRSHRSTSTARTGRLRALCLLKEPFDDRWLSALSACWLRKLTPPSY